MNKALSLIIEFLTKEKKGVLKSIMVYSFLIVIPLKFKRF